MPHTHEFDCIVCGAHFDSTADLQRHNEEQHLHQGAGMEKPRQSDSNTDSDSDDRLEPPQN